MRRVMLLLRPSRGWLLITVTSLAMLLILAGCQSPPEAPAAVDEPAPSEAPPTEALPSPAPVPSATPEPTATAEPTATEPVEETPTATVSATETSMAPDAIFAPASAEPVVPHGPPGSWDGQYTDPGAVVYHDGAFHMFHNGFVGWPAPVGIAYSTSPDGYEWTRVREEPVFQGDDLEYVGLTALASSALVEEDGTWVLYFYSWDERTWPNSTSVIGRATAPDPQGPWTADEQPVLLPGSEGAWDDEAVRTPSVLRDEDGYVMYYAGFDGQQGMIGMATSEDGVHWTKYDDPATSEAPFAESDPVFQAGNEGAWDVGHVIHPRVVRSPNGYVMLYSGVPRLNVTSTLGYAVSDDGIAWQRAPEPVLQFSDVPGGRAIWFSELVYQDGTYYLFFELGTGGQTEVYLATREGSLPAP